nr:IS4 family transposase [Thiorhodovibrio winogradskyi]
MSLGDQRLNRRAQQVIASLGAKPTQSIPGACNGWYETRAAYRFFNHPKVTAKQVLAPHIACTEARVREYPRVLCIQDTSEGDFTTKKGIAGLGPLNYESRHGMYIHPTLAVTPERVALGLLDVHTFTREPGSLGQDKDPLRPLEERESVRWVDGDARVNELAETLIIAWRVLYLTMLGRECPEMPCDAVFAEEEWKAVYLVTQRQAPPEQPPPLDTMVRMVASLGGFLNRKCDGFPGPKTLWIGLQRIPDFVRALEAYRSVGESYG